MEARRPSLIQDLASEREYYFCFCAWEGNVPWWQKLYMDFFSHKFYKHVSLLAPLGEGGVLFLEPLEDRIETHVAITPPLDAVEKLKEMGYVVVRYKHNLSDSRVRCKWNLIPSCVTVVKVFSGVSAPAVTPYGLLKWLMKKDCKVM